MTCDACDSCMDAARVQYCRFCRCYSCPHRPRCGASQGAMRMLAVGTIEVMS